jgi:hypothetical protein
MANLKESVKNLPIEPITKRRQIVRQESADENTQQIITTHHVRSVCLEYSISWPEKRIHCIAITLTLADTLVLLSEVDRKSIDDAVWQKWW